MWCFLGSFPWRIPSDYYYFFFCQFLFINSAKLKKTWKYNISECSYNPDLFRRYKVDRLSSPQRKELEWGGLSFKLPGWYLQIIKEINQTTGLNISFVIHIPYGQGKKKKKMIRKCKNSNSTLPPLELHHLRCCSHVWRRSACFPAACKR